MLCNRRLRSVTNIQLLRVTVTLSCSSGALSSAHNTSRSSKAAQKIETFLPKYSKKKAAPHITSALLPSITVPVFHVLCQRVLAFLRISFGQQSAGLCTCLHARHRPRGPDDAVGDAASQRQTLLGGRAPIACGHTGHRGHVLAHAVRAAGPAQPRRWQRGRRGGLAVAPRGPISSSPTTRAALTAQLNAHLYLHKQTI